MYHTKGRLILSATDIVKFAACEHLTQLELYAAAGAIQYPDESNETAEVLQKRGAEHELRYLEYLQKTGREVIELPRAEPDLDALLAADNATASAMRRGVDVIYQ